jgi:uridine kinase
MVSGQRLVEIRLGERSYSVPYGTPVGEVLAVYGPAEPLTLAAIVHNRCVDLSFPLTAGAEVRAVHYGMREGVLVYRRAASLILLEAARQLFGPAAASIGQSMGNGHLWEIRPQRAFAAEQAAPLEERMRELVARDLPLRTELVMLAEAKRIFSAAGEEDKLRLLKTWWESHVTLVYCGEFCDIHHYPVAPRTGLVRHFELLPRPSGVLLRFPTRQRPDLIAPLEERPKLRQVYSERRDWLELLGVSSVGQLNELTLKGQAGELIRIAEGLHEKKIAQIADHICHQAQPARLVLIAGPSSSGKTTFAARLSLQLRINGAQAVGLSTDNFYVNRGATPLDEHGEPDFEALDAIDLELFNRVLTQLLAGKEVLTPRYDFVRGRRRPKSQWRPLRLAPGQVLLVEGIHGLNPRLTAAVEEQHKFRIYTNAMTQLSLDDHNRIFTSDTRLLRRIVRDRLFRGYSAQQTIAAWARVRRGEQRWIFPFQEAADVIFNSELVYEHAVLRLYAERYLLEVPEEHPSFVDAYRLLRFVEYFVPMFDETIPETSLLREFIGGSYFQY